MTIMTYQQLLKKNFLTNDEKILNDSLEKMIKLINIGMLITNIIL